MQGEVEALPAEVDVDAVGELRSALADVGHIVGSDLSVTADVPDDGIAVCVGAVIDVAEEIPYGISGLESGADLIVGTAGRIGSLACSTVGELENPVVEGGEVAADAVAEIADVVPPAELELPTAVEHAAAVDGGGGGAKLRRRGDAEEEVLRLLVEVLDGRGQAVVEHTEVETEVGLLRDLPVEVRVGQAAAEVRSGTVGGTGLVDVVLIPASCRGDAGGVAVAAQNVDVTVAAPGGAEFQEVEQVVVNIVLEEALVADGPAGGEGREVSPAVLLGELGGIGSVGAEVGLELIAVVIAPDDTAEVGERSAPAREVANALGGLRGIGGHVVEIVEVLGVVGEDVVTTGAGADVVAVVLAIGHTGHEGEVVLANVEEVVGEVLPLIVVTGVGVGGDGVVILGSAAYIERSGVAVADALGDAVAEAGCDSQALDGHEVGVHRTVDVEAAAA